MEHVDSFKYLGITIKNNGKIESEIKETFNRAIELHHSLNNVLINKRELFINQH